MKRWMNYSLLFAIGASSAQVLGQEFVRDYNVAIYVNQIGYLPDATKTCVMKSDRDIPFAVVKIETNEVVYEGIMKSAPGAFGTFANGDFSQVESEGHYYIWAEQARSYPFSISQTVYSEAMKMIVGYFSLQRCGNSSTGYLSPCHLDDGVRLDNGKHQDVTGGWHDASDTRKWVSATIHGMIGLGRLYEATHPGEGDDEIIEELKWGNQYFLKMQEPEGYVMNFIGGEVRQNWDSNRWTDNVIGEDGGELRLVSPTGGTSMNPVLVFGNKDDRIIQTEPVHMTGQYNFIISEAVMARIMKNKEPSYSERCLNAARRCFEWCRESEKSEDPGILGSAIVAALEMHKTTRLGEYKEFAVDKANSLAQLQSEEGFYFVSPSKQRPYKNIMNGCTQLIAGCDLIEAFPDHEDAAKWKLMVKRQAEDYLLEIAKLNNFGVVPFGMYAGGDPGGNRKRGQYWYRYFMFPKGWWTGINANLASTGIALIKASRVLSNRDLKRLSQRQLDWIVGVNPFNSSTIVGVGYNHPRQFVNGVEFRPATPVLPGAVMNGLGGTEDDMPTKHEEQDRGSYHVSEYWTPMVAYTLWLLAALQFPSH